MKLVVQRVSNANVEVDNKIVGKINKGLMVLVGFGVNDSTKEADFLSKKLLKLRIFEDEDDRMNRSVLDIEGELLLVPQFTLYASTKKIDLHFIELYLLLMQLNFLIISVKNVRKKFMLKRVNLVHI